MESGVRSLLAAAACEAVIGWRTDIVDGDARDVAITCDATFHLGQYRDARGRQHFHCDMIGHRQNVLDNHPAATSGSVAWDEWDA